MIKTNFLKFGQIMNKIIFVGVYYIFIILLFFVILLFALVKLKQDVKDNQHDNDVKGVPRVIFLPFFRNPNFGPFYLYTR